MAEIIELNQEGQGHEQKHRSRHRVKIRKRVKVKKKANPKLLFAKIIKVALWVLVLGAFAFTLITLFKTSDVDYKGGKEGAPTKMK
jgi:hypothetical protein